MQGRDYRHCRRTALTRGQGHGHGNSPGGTDRPQGRVARGTAQEHEGQGALRDRAREDARTGPRIPCNHPHRGGEHWPFTRAGHHRGKALSGLRQPHMYAGLSSEHQHTFVHQEHRAWRVPQCRPCAEEHLCPACRVRTCMSPGEAVRKPVHAPEDGAPARGHRLSGALYRRLRARERTYLPARSGSRQRQEDCRHRFRSCRPELCGRHGQVWL